MRKQSLTFTGKQEKKLYMLREVPIKPFHLHLSSSTDNNVISYFYGQKVKHDQIMLNMIKLHAFRHLKVG